MFGGILKWKIRKLDKLGYVGNKSEILLYLFKNTCLSRISGLFNLYSWNNKLKIKLIKINFGFFRLYIRTICSL